MVFVQHVDSTTVAVLSPGEQDPLLYHRFDLHHRFDHAIGLNDYITDHNILGLVDGGLRELFKVRPSTDDEIFVVLLKGMRASRSVEGQRNMSTNEAESGNEDCADPEELRFPRGLDLCTRVAVATSVEAAATSTAAGDTTLESIDVAINASPKRPSINRDESGLQSEQPSVCHSVNAASESGSEPPAASQTDSVETGCMDAETAHSLGLPAPCAAAAAPATSNGATSILTSAVNMQSMDATFNASTPTKDSICRDGSGPVHHSLCLSQELSSPLSSTRDSELADSVPKSQHDCISLLARIPTDSRNSALKHLSRLIQSFMRQVDSYNFGPVLSFNFQPEPIRNNKEEPVTSLIFDNAGNSTIVISLGISEQWRADVSFQAFPSEGQQIDSKNVNQLVVIPAKKTSGFRREDIEGVKLYARNPSRFENRRSKKDKPDWYTGMLTAAQLAQFCLMRSRSQANEDVQPEKKKEEKQKKNSIAEDETQQERKEEEKEKEKENAEEYLVIQNTSDIRLTVEWCLPVEYCDLKISPCSFKVPQTPFPGVCSTFHKLWPKDQEISSCVKSVKPRLSDGILELEVKDSPDTVRVHLSPYFNFTDITDRMQQSRSSQDDQCYNLKTIFKMGGMDIPKDARHCAFFAPDESNMWLSLGGFALFADKTKELIEIWALNGSWDAPNDAVYFSGPCVTSFDPNLKSQFFKIPASSPLGCMQKQSPNKPRRRMFDSCMCIPPGTKVGEQRVRSAALCFRSMEHPGFMVYFCFKSKPPLQPSNGINDEVKCQVSKTQSSSDDGLSVQEQESLPRDRRHSQLEPSGTTLTVTLPGIKYCNTGNSSFSLKPACGASNSDEECPQECAPVITIFRVHRNLKKSKDKVISNDWFHCMPGHATSDGNSQTAWSLSSKEPPHKANRVNNVISDVLENADKAIGFMTKEQHSEELEAFLDSIFGSSWVAQGMKSTTRRSSMAIKVGEGLDTKEIHNPIREFYNPIQEQQFQDMKPQAVLGIVWKSIDRDTQKESQKFLICNICQPPKSFWADQMDEHMRLAAHDGVGTVEADKIQYSCVPESADGYQKVIIESARAHANTFIAKFHDYRDRRGLATCGKERCLCNPGLEDAMTIHTYTQQSPIFKKCNAAMRENNAPQWVPYIVRLTASLRKLPTFQGTVYRGIANCVSKGLYSTDNLVVWHSFSSSSKSSKVAEGFLAADNTNSTLFVIESKSGRMVSPLSAFVEEAEVVFPPNCIFRVMSDLNQGVLELLSQAMKRSLKGMQCYNLLEVVNFESGLTENEWRQLEPLILRLQTKKDTVRRKNEMDAFHKDLLADHTVKDVFYDCLRMYPGPMRLLAHEYGAAHVLFVALEELESYQHSGAKSRVAAQVLVDLLVRVKEEQKEENGEKKNCFQALKRKEGRHKELKQYSLEGFLSIFKDAAWKMHDIWAIHGLHNKGLLEEPEDDYLKWKKESEVNKPDANYPNWISEACTKILELEIKNTGMPGSLPFTLTRLLIGYGNNKRELLNAEDMARVLEPYSRYAASLKHFSFSFLPGQ